MAESPGIKRLRQAQARVKRAEQERDACVAELLREGEFVENIAAALDWSREKVRRKKDELGIRDAREIRREKGLPLRRSRD